MSKGYVSVPRSIRDTSFWPSNREFSFLEALLDMRLNSRSVPGSASVNGKTVMLRANEVAMSQSYMQERYRWTRSTVRTFLKHLQLNQAINQRTDQGETVIILLKSMVFEVLEPSEHHPTNQQNDQLATSCPPTANHNKKGKRKKGKGRKDSPPSSASVGEDESICAYLWEHYPPKGKRRSTKKKTWTAWEKLKASERPSLETITKALGWWKKTDNWQDQDGQFVPGLHRFISNEMWNDTEDEDAPSGNTPPPEPPDWRERFAKHFPSLPIPTEPYHELPLAMRETLYPPENL